MLFRRVSRSLKNLLGVWAEEIDSLYPNHNIVLKTDSQTYQVTDYCERIHANDAEVLARFESGGYDQRPALTVNNVGNGRAYYIASSNEQRFYDDFYQELANELTLSRVLNTEIPEGVSVQKRTDGQTDYVFIMNFTEQPQTLELPQEETYTNMLTDQSEKRTLTVEPYQYRILKK